MQGWDESKIDFILFPPDGVTVRLSGLADSNVESGRRDSGRPTSERDVGCVETVMVCIVRGRVSDIRPGIENLVLI